MSWTDEQRIAAGWTVPDGKGGFSKAKPEPGRADIQRGDGWKIAELERCVRYGALVAAQAKERAPRNVLVRVTSYRTHLLDEDNLCEKYHVDLCRYAGVIHGDSPATTRIEVAQGKVSTGEREFVRIEVFKL